MEKHEPCSVIDERGKKVVLFINSAALADVVEAFKDLSVQQSSIGNEAEHMELEIVQKAISH